MTKPAPIQFRIDDTLRAQLAARSTEGRAEGTTARRDLERYYAALNAELRSLKFTRNEWLLLFDVNNGTLYESWSVPLLWANLEDALPDGYAGDWDVDGPALVARLKGLTHTQALAVVDAVERWWGAADQDRAAVLTGIMEVRK